MLLDTQPAHLSPERSFCASAETGSTERALNNLGGLR